MCMLMKLRTPVRDIEIEVGDPAEEGDGGELAHYGNNLYIELDGREFGSLWLHDEDGEPVLSLGQYDEDTQGWEPRNDLRRLPPGFGTDQ